MVVSRRWRECTGVRAGVEQREAAGAVGRFHHAGREAALPDGRRLLVAGDAAGCGSAPPNRSGRVSPNSAAQSRTSGSSARGTPNSRSRSCVPCAAADIEQQRARRIGRVGGVDLAAGEPPEQERIHRAECKPALLAPPRAHDSHGRAASRSWSPRNTDRAAGRSWPRRAARARRARSAAQASAVRRSCQTMALWIGLPLTRSQTIVVSRWLVMPMRGDILGVHAGLGHGLADGRDHVDQISSGSCSTHPGAG